MRRREDKMDSGIQIPEEVIEEILVKLPVKSLVRSRCVSKSWFNLVKSRRFMLKHLIVSDESFLALCFFARKSNDEWETQPFLACNDPWQTQRFSAIFRYADDEETSATRVHEGLKRLINRQGDDEEAAATADYMLPMFDFELPSSFDGCSPELVGECNGILCFSNYKSIMLVNPLSKEVKTFPIDVNTSEDCQCVGFGFDSITMDFKVVTILSLTRLQRNGEHEIVGRRAQSPSWKRLYVVCPIIYASLYGCTFLNGVVHWYTKTQHSGWRILTFDMATELFEEIEFPQGTATQALRLFVLNQDSLALVYYPFPFKSSTGCVDVWTLNKRSEKTEEVEETRWTKIYSIGHLNQFVRPACFWKKNKFLYTTTNQKLVWYDLLDHSSFVVGDVVSHLLPAYDKHDFKVHSQFGICKSTLLSINM